MDKAVRNTDRELWRERPGDAYADSLFVTQSGGIGMNVGGRVLVMPLQTWHRMGIELGERLRFETPDPLVLIESPLRGATPSETVANTEYARRAAARTAGRPISWRTLEHTPLLAAEVQTGDDVQLVEA